MEKQKRSPKKPSYWGYLALLAVLFALGYCFNAFGLLDALQRNPSAILSRTWSDIVEMGGLFFLNILCILLGGFSAFHWGVTAKRSGRDTFFHFIFTEVILFLSVQALVHMMGYIPTGTYSTIWSENQDAVSYKVSWLIISLFWGMIGYALGGIICSTISASEEESTSTTT